MGSLVGRVCFDFEMDKVAGGGERKMFYGSQWARGRGGLLI